MCNSADAVVDYDTGYARFVVYCSLTYCLLDRRATTTTCFVEEGPDPSKVGFVLKSDDSTPFLRIPAKRPIGPVVKGPLTNKSVSPQATAVSQ